MIDTFGDNGFFKLARAVELEQVAGGQGEEHALVVGLEMVVDLGEDQGGKLALGERFVFIESLTVLFVATMVSIHQLATA